MKIGGRGLRPAPFAMRGMRIPPLAALIFIIVLLLLFNLPNMRLLGLLEESKRRDLADRMASVAATIVNGLKQAGLPLILRFSIDQTPEEQERMLSDYGDTPSHAQLERNLANMQSLNSLAQIIMLTPGGLVVADSADRMQPGEAYVFRDIDRAQINAALDGTPAITPLYYINSQPFLRHYHPIVQDGRVAGLMQVTASPDYLYELERLKRRFVLQSLISSALLIVVGWSLYRLFSWLVRAEQSALRSARIEAMGALAGGVAHELRNPLSIIRVLAEEITETDNQDAPPPGESRITRNARDIVGEVKRLNEMITNFLSLSRPPDASADSPVALGAGISSVVQLMRKGAPHSVKFVFDAPPAELFTRADERAVRQLLLNLLINASEALREAAGEVRVTLRERKGAAEIRISDNGRGIEPREITRIFEPFFTTKKMGTGLGLPIRRGIAENLGGSIGITSRPGQGTEVIVRLPIQPRTTTDNHGQPTKHSPPLSN
ncbi:MAG: ATP-binding protein [bacterium]